jgi:hypothetical protein
MLPDGIEGIGFEVHRAKVVEETCGVEVHVWKRKSEDTGNNQGSALRVLRM